MSSLEETIAAVQSPDTSAMAAARHQQRELTKPAGSLGTLERLHVQLAGIQRTPHPSMDDPCIVVMAADHGVAAEGVSAYPSNVTGQMARNFLAGGAAINVLAHDAAARLLVVDLGVAWEDDPPVDGLIRRAIGRGTANIAEGPAMTRDQARRALAAGIEIANSVASDGADLLALGEMGIGNTTASAAIVAATTNRSPTTVTGVGTGVDRAGWEHKVDVVGRALAVNRDRLGDPLGVLAALGGFEIAGLAGAMLGAAARRVPIVLDGLIVTAAALIAVGLCPTVQAYILASHRSAEPGHRIALEYLELEAMMDLSLRLGEGTGAALALHLVRAACRIPREMATFDRAGVARATGDREGSTWRTAAPPAAASDAKR